MRIGAFIIAITLLVWWTRAQTTQPAIPPATQPSSTMPAQQKLDEMLKPAAGGGAKPLQPQPGPVPIDVTTGGAAIAPGATTMPVMREGTFLVDRMGRITRSADGQSWEFTFEADGRAMQDPPVVILPNLKLTLMEQAVKTTNRDLKFRVTGMVTEYNGRNYLLLEKVVVPPDSTMQF